MVSASVDHAPILERLAPDAYWSDQQSHLRAPALLTFGTAPAVIFARQFAPAPFSRVSVAPAGALACSMLFTSGQVPFGPCSRSCWG